MTRWQEHNVIKQSIILSAVLLSACSVVPKQQAPAPVQKPAEPVVVKPELVRDEVVHSENAQPIATDFGMIFIERDMSFTGILPCQNCPGVQYHINVMRDGTFAARREYIDRNKIEIIQGQWHLDQRNLHFTSSQGQLPSFMFGSNRHITLLDIAGKPIVSAENQTLTRLQDFTKLDTRLPMLGLYQVANNQARFTDCYTGVQHEIAMTQHHLPMMRSYQADPALQGKPIIATLTARQNPEQANVLFVDRFDQFWPGANCPAQQPAENIEGIVWRLKTVSAIAVPQKLNIRMVFAPNNKVFGYSGCNNFNAGFQRKDNQLQVMPVVSTRKQCHEASFYEQQFTQQLQAADRIELNQQKLQLLKDNQVIMELQQAVN